MLRKMKIALPLICLLLTNPVLADPFIGFKLAPLDMDIATTDDPLNLAVNIGTTLDTWVADYSLIAEFNHTVDEGKTRQGEELELNANAVYLLWKTTRSMYVSLRGGVVRNEIVEGGDSRSTTGPLLGASIGQVIGRTRLQIEYTSLAGEANFYGISLEFDF